MTRPLIIAHRGASGYLPDHTLEGYQRAIALGADYIEPDLVRSRDGVLVARHEPMLGATTNVADHPAFADRRRTLQLDGVSVTDWFACDFSFAELRSLRARQPMPWRDQSHNDLYLIPSFAEVIALAQQAGARLGRVIGVAPETKHPSWHDELGLGLEQPLVAALAEAGWTGPDAPVIIQSFETANLRWLRRRLGVKLLQLVDGGGCDATGAMTLDPHNRGPFDWRLAGDSRSWADLLTPQGLAEARNWADYIAPWKRWLIPTRAATAADGLVVEAEGEGARMTLPPSGVVRDAHAVGLGVITWTVRSEPQFLAGDYHGDAAAEVRALLALGVDGLFTDVTDVAVAVRDAMARG